MAMLAKGYSKGMDPTGWWLSEKLDGVRALWDGENFYSRGGKLFYVPEELKAGMPACKLDGEFTMGRGLFQKTVSVVRRKNGSSAEAWSEIRYQVFEMPDLESDFETRHDYLESLDLPSWVFIVAHFKCRGYVHLRKYYGDLLAIGAEGVMLSAPRSLYVDKRSANLLKYKPISNDEATVTGYKPGGGKYIGMVGALRCINGKGVEFAVGTGLVDSQRANPPAVGSKFTYAYQGLTDAGVPRFPAFVAVRDYE